MASGGATVSGHCKLWRPGSHLHSRWWPAAGATAPHVAGNEVAGRWLATQWLAGGWSKKWLAGAGKWLAGSKWLGAR